MANLRANKITSTEVFETTGSVQFDGDGDYFNLNGESDFAFGTGDFTIEGWFYLNNNSSSLSIYDSRPSGSNGDQVALFYSGGLNGVCLANNGTIRIQGTTYLNTGEWYHITLCRYSNISKLFINGSQDGIDYYDTTDYQNPSGRPYIGVSGGTTNGSNSWNGHISNVRILKGTALYTKNFTPPTRELTVIPNTVLLACQSTTNTAQEATGKTITVNGNAVANELTPGLLTDVVKSGGTSAITGSVEFDGSGDYLTLANNSDFNFGTGDFTVECFIYVNKHLAGGTDVIVSTYQDSSNGWTLGIHGFTPTDKFYFGIAGDSSQLNSSVLYTDSWVHLAAARSGSTAKFFINGVEVTSASNSTNQTSTSDLHIGTNVGGGALSTEGFISNLRIVKGTALYTSDFIPPTRELKNIPGTVLLCCKDSNDPTAEETGKTITANGDPTGSNFTPQVGDDRQVTFEGVTKINTENYFYLPTGDTVTRDSRSGRGLFGGAMAPSFNDTIDLINIPTMGNAVDFGDIFSGRYTGACSSSTRAVFGGGEDPSSVTNVMDFVTIATNSDAIDFGDLTQARRQSAGCSSSTRGLFGGGSTPTNVDTIDFITIASTGDATDFGNLTVARRGIMSCSSPVRGVWSGGIGPGSTFDVIDYVTISSTGNALDFGDLTTDRRNIADGGCSSQVRGVFGGGRRVPANANSTVIDYITIASKGNAQDFGDITTATSGVSACSTLIRGVFAGGYQPTVVNTMEYVTIASTGNAADFGDTTIAGHSRAGCSDSHGGLG
jgi:hypothetical protein